MSSDTVLSSSEIESVVEVRLADPFALLGRHPLGPEHEGRTEVRTFCPAAKRAWIRPGDGGTEEMSRVHPEGLFTWISEPGRKDFPYLLEFEADDGSRWQTPDPYAFGPQLGEMDLHLLGEGRHERLYERLGGRIWSVGQVRGALFSVWAPNARQVSVVGDFNGWDRRRHPMRTRGSSGMWELFVPLASPGDLYKFSIRTAQGRIVEKADPLALRSEFRPRTASVLADPSPYEWSDGEWMKARAKTDPLSSTVSVYEVHALSWRRPDDGSPVSWDFLRRELIPYVRGLGFTHIELLPIMEYPFDASWGYQTTGYFSPTSRLGTPGDFAAFVDECHRSGIGVILDWVPAHFPDDEFALARFDGTALYEHEDPRLGRHPDWDTLIFNYGRNEVRNFLLASALFWLDRYHVDGLRVDAVASMLYLDYSREAGQWLPNRYGGNENLAAIDFLKELNSRAHGLHPGVMMIAEESTAWPGVTRPTHLGGLGFTLKWNMGWMHDTLRFMSKEAVHRKHHLNDLTFSLLYAYTENFLLPLSHDEVVHGKASLLSRMPGDRWQKMASLRLLLAYQWAHPGKQMLFMGAELGQWDEWDHESQLDWALAEYPEHGGVSRLVGDLNRLYRDSPALYRQDCSSRGFSWIDFRDQAATVVSFVREAGEGEQKVVCVFNMTPVVREGYRIGVPEGGTWREALNTDSQHYGGSGVGNLGEVAADPEAWHGHDWSVCLTLPPLAALFLRSVPDVN